MFYIKAVATQLVDDRAYPEIVLCEFTDAHGCKYTFTEKWPVISDEQFENNFPKSCLLGCVLVEKKTETYIVDTEKPWDIESAVGKTIFEINEDLLLKDDE